MNNYETNRSTIHQAILTVVTILPSSFSSLSLLLAVFLLVDFSQLKPSLSKKIHNRLKILYSSVFQDLSKIYLSYYLFAPAPEGGCLVGGVSRLGKSDWRSPALSH